jgi:formate hydrogenlyase subunit 6/NADH:ubiquinone oxidoreductase subunit I
LCLKSCEGASDPHTQLRKSECFVCFNCIEDCPEDALSFSLFPQKSHEVAGTSIPRRKAIFAAFIGVLFYPFVRASGRTTHDFSTQVIRPPGSVEELEFLERCIKCDQCIRVCPTNVLQPAWFEAGLEGLWTPILNFRMGHCQLNCTACGQVCPTGAIQRVSVEEKLGWGKHAEAGPIVLGTAHFDMGRCLPYSKNIPCVVCEEVCPTSPKAIHTERQTRTVRDGKKMATSATDTTVTVCEWPEAGRSIGEPVLFDINGWQGDETTRYFILVRHADGLSESHQVIGNDTDTLMIDGKFARPVQPGTSIVLQLEFKVPKIDTNYCIGCGICERECPVVGDRRAVYVTAEGESRSRDYRERNRNRSLRLFKTASADSAGGSFGNSPPGAATAGATASSISLGHMVLAPKPAAKSHSGCGCSGGSCGSGVTYGAKPKKSSWFGSPGGCSGCGGDQVARNTAHKVDLTKFFT